MLIKSKLILPTKNMRGYSFMRKLIIALLIVAMLPAFVACENLKIKDLDINTHVEYRANINDDTEYETEENVEIEDNNDTENSENSKNDTSAEINSNEDKVTILADGDVDPDLKKQLDNYEKLMDDFIEISSKYKDIDNADSDEDFNINILVDYNNFITNNSDVIMSFKDIDPDSLTGADKEYFDEITQRVEQKRQDAGLE